MPDNKKDVFVILEEMKRRVLGITDKNPKAPDGFLVSFLPTGEAVNPDDFKKPYKPNMTSPNNVQPPAQPGDPEVTADIGKRYENLANTCTLVDSKIRLNEIYQPIENSSTISQTWEIIIKGANVMPMDPAQEEFQKKQFAKFFPRLRKTIKDEDGQDVEVNTKEYKAYKEFETKYGNALLEYAAAYQVAMSNRQTAQTWGITGKIPLRKVDSAWNEWVSLGSKEFIEQAIDNLAAMGTDAAAHMIAMAKKKFEAYSIATQGVIPVTSQYVEIFPSNWCETNVENDGWTNYEYSWEKKVETTKVETSIFSANGGVSFGFWSAKANVSRDKREEHNDLQVDGLEMKFSYTILDVNRPWLDTLLFDLGNWFLVGDFPKGSISNGKMDQVFPETNARAWLPIIPKKIIVLKNLWIKTNHIHDHFDSLTKEVGGGGSVGIGPFNLSGSYSSSKTNTTFTAEKEGEGLSVKGVQIMGWISNLVQFSPKIDAPKKDDN
jgi:hypothetical protein